MKNILLISILAILSGTVCAQAPATFKYQAVICDNNGDLVKEQDVSFRISILQGSETGSSVYQETHSVTTSIYGQASIEIGNGDEKTADLADISWGDDSYFIKIELDLANGTDYIAMGTSQLLSVPMAQYAENAGNMPAYVSTLSVNTEENWGGFSAGGQVLLTNGTTSWGTQLVLKCSDLEGGMMYSLNSLGGNADGGQSQGKFVITNDNGAAFTIDSTRNIGIGTTSPASLLHVADGALKVENGSIQLNTESDGSAINMNGDLYIDKGTIYSDTGMIVIGGMGIFGTGESTWGTQILLNASSLDGGMAYKLNSLGGIAEEGQGKFIIANDNGAAFTIDSTRNIGIGTIEPVSKLQVSDGDIYIDEIGSGVIMKSPNGSCWRMTVSDAGAAEFTAITCPEE